MQTLFFAVVMSLWAFLAGTFYEWLRRRLDA